MASKKEQWEKIMIFINQFRSELILVGISLLIMIISLGIFLNTSQGNDDMIAFQQNEKLPSSSADVIFPPIVIDIAGSVEEPDVYEVTSGARLKDVLILSGGLSQEADRDFFARTFNLAKKLVDQEKIYIPSRGEVSQGKIAGVFKSNDDLVNINTASFAELDTLSGVGPVMAQKIIDNRPYASAEELLNKKVVSKSVFEKIKDNIML